MRLPKQMEDRTTQNQRKVGHLLLKGCLRRRRRALLHFVQYRGHWAPAYPPILTPMISPETTSSTRRFFCRPAAVLLSATGTVSPNPLAVMAALSKPCWAI